MAKLRQDARCHAPATMRNRDAILAALRQHLPQQGLVLEIASGTGEHAVHFAAGLPGLSFQPSDRDDRARTSINAWVRAARLPNLHPALALDTTAETWPIDTADAVFAANMIHIAPWAATLGLVAGAARLLPPGAPLILYGPFRRGGEHTAPSNAAFDADLRAHDPEWGVRDLEAVTEAATGFTAPLVEPMPANNFLLVFRRR
jgi:hypothetical protein